MNRLNHEFTPHSNIKNELIQAEHVNELQVAISDSQRVLNRYIKAHFLNQVFFQFKNQDRFNGVRIYEYDNQFCIDAIRSTNLKWDENQSGLTLDHPSKDACLITKPFSSHLDESILTNFAIASDVSGEEGELIWYLLMGDGEEEHLIDASFTASSLVLLPHELKTNAFRLKIIFKANEAGMSPMLHGFACFYEDEVLASQLVTTVEG